MLSKLRPHHLQRQADVDLRQSTPGQVDTHRERTERPYALADRAVELGWDRGHVVLLDQDLGTSGTTTQGRDAFHRLMAAVGLAEVGAVFALEASRCSRSPADWHRLLDRCALTDTLVVDHAGVDAPNEVNDRVLLGFTGTWSHPARQALRLRLHGATLHKAHNGALRCNPPTGDLYDLAGALVVDPDASVVAALRLLFEQFQTLGSAYGVLRSFADQQCPLPRRLWAPGTNGRLHWGPLSLRRLLAILHNPTDTGASVYGRRRSQPVVIAGQVVRVRTRPRPTDQWTVVLQGAHAASLSWEEDLEHQRQLPRNRTDLASEGRRGVPREGAALLPGLWRCGRCGRRMTVRYDGPGGRRAAYPCDRRRCHDGQGGLCWSVPARPLAAAVERHVRGALTRENLDLALAVLTQLEADARELDHHWQLPREPARDEAQRAERQFAAVEPENRLVARTLERCWNEQLQQVDARERTYAEARRRQRLEVSPHERQQILRLAADLPAVWNAPTTTQAERQELLSLLVKQIALTPVDGPPRQTRVQGLWHPQATTELVISRPKKQERLRTPLAVVDAIARLATGRTDDAIAAALNALGLRSGRNPPLTSAAVAWIRDKSQIRKPGSDPRLAARLDARPDGRYATRALATHLGVTMATVHDWREHGIMPAIHETPGGPWWHTVTPAVLAALRQHIRRVSLRTDDPWIPNAHCRRCIMHTPSVSLTVSAGRPLWGYRAV